ncbi:hypothetical protein BDZ45DRAFT_305679 [Acephala macrosclerotiorum]|nr:hypothetical protein BDZ45DRAFT_305679 [Acephala macrosclerotiorum]
MSATRSGRGSGRGSSGRTEGKYDWSEWVWNEGKGKYYRYRTNSKGKEVSESTATLPDATTPRSIVPSTTDEYEDNNTTSSSFDGSQHYYGGDSYEYRGQASAFTKDPIEDLSEDFANTSLNEQGTSRYQDEYYYQQRGYQEPADTQQIGNYQSNMVAVMDPYRTPAEYPRESSMYSSSGTKSSYMGASSSNFVAKRTSYFVAPINTSTSPLQEADYGDLGNDPALMSQSYTSQATITPGRSHLIRLQHSFAWALT